MKVFYKFNLLIILLFVASLVYGQRTVTGKINDSKTGEALIGVNVVVPGTTYGTSTDIDGKYNISLIEGQNQLEYSYVGYKTQTINLADYRNNVIDVTLKEGSLLDEVVVIGYGTAKKREATGAIETIDSEDFNGGVISSPEQLIQGRAAGVQITSSSGEPGAGINLRIRGASSIRSGNNPLYVVDGVPLLDVAVAEGVDAKGGIGASSPRNPLTFINPNDIQSIDVLKDASATAIYGSRGANGVIMITTKGGEFNKGVDYRYGLNISGITKRYDLLSSSEYLAAGGNDNGSETDWQDEVFRTAISHDHNIGFGGGTVGKGHYRLSLGIAQIDGIVKNSGMDRLSARFNGEQTVFDNRLTLKANIIASQISDQFVAISDRSGFEGDLLASALKSNPTLAGYVGDSIVQDLPAEPTPIALLNYTKDNQQQMHILGSVLANLKITDNIAFTNILGQNWVNTRRSSAYSRDLIIPAISGLGRLYTLNGAGSSSLWESYLNYNQEFDAIGINAVVGYSYQNFDVERQQHQFSKFRTSDLDLMINNSSSAESSTIINSSKIFDELQSQFARVAFDWQNKLFVSASLRRDGSTKFGPDFKYGIFPAFGIKYDLTQDGFLPESINNLGLRVGWGRTGNSSIPHNLYQFRSRYSDYDINNEGDVTSSTEIVVADRNDKLKWESTEQFNVGLDFAFADYKIAGSINWYNKNTNDLLIKTVYAQPAVGEFIWENIGADVINTGVELDLRLYPVSNQNFTWGVLGNLSFNSNEVKNLNGSIYDSGEINGQGLTGAFAQRIAEGQPLYAFFVRDFAGYDAEGVSEYNGGDVQQFTGAQPQPKIVAGLTNTFDIGRINISAFISGQFGHYLYNNTANAFFTKGALANGRNVTKNVVDSNEGSLNAPDVSTRFLEKADFVRLKLLSLGYSLPINNNNYFKDVRLFLQSTNLLTFTGYSGQDPEVDTNKSIDDIPSLGIDYTAYPQARAIMVGAQIKFN